jgi:hydrogenase maturation protease
MKILIIGYGNPGRLDDGLGPALAERFRQAEPAPGNFQALEQLTVESNYQLNVEDAAQIAEYDVVVFADASTDVPPPFSFEPVVPAAGGLSFSSHSVSAPQLLGMVKELFHAEPAAWMLAIRGVEFDAFGEKLSPAAKENLDRAADFLKEWLQEANDE